MLRFASSLLIFSIASNAAAQAEVLANEPPAKVEANGMSIAIQPKRTVPDPAQQEFAEHGELTETTPKEAPTPKPATPKLVKKKQIPKIKIVEVPKNEERNAETSLRYLINGNSRFVKRNFRADGRTAKDRTRGLDGETPHTALLASSDSRVVPEIIFDQGLGEIYTVRSFGENLDPSVIAGLEYAVEKLNVPLLVVLGNSDCAAMKIQKVNAFSNLSPSMKSVVDAVQPRLKTLKSDEPSPSYEVEATLNADGVARELARRSQIIREAVDSGKLTIKSGLYRINTGRVNFY